MQGLTVARKIVLAFAILFVVFVAFGVFASFTGHRLNLAAVRLQEANEGVMMASRIANWADVVRRNDMYRIMDTNPAHQAAYDSRIQQAQQQVEQLFQQYDASLNTMHYNSEADRDEDRAFYTADLQTWQEFLQAINTVQASLNAGNRPEAIARSVGDVRSVYRRFLDAIQRDEQDSMNRANNASAAASTEYVNVVRFTTIVIVAVLVFVVACAMKLYRDIMFAVNKILYELQQVGDGQLDKEISVTRSDEFGLMAGQINRTIRNIRTIVKDIRNTCLQVSDAAEQFLRNCEESARATQSVAQSITEVAGAAHQQVESITDTRQQIERFNSGVEQAVHLVSNIVGEVKSTTTQATDGNALVQSTVTQMDTIANTVDSSSKAVAKLGERSKEIGSIVELISGISGQTNLLALNAAIEAARVGAAGRGFAVVADEVRKLAEESRKAAEQINELVKTVQTETNQAVAVMEQGRSEAEKGREKVRATGEGFSKILEMIRRVHEGSNSIQETMVGLNARASQITSSTNKISNASARVSSSSENVSASSEEQAASVEEIASSAQNLIEMVNKMRDTTEKFKL